MRVLPGSTIKFKKAKRAKRAKTQPNRPRRKASRGQGRA